MHEFDLRPATAADLGDVLRVKRALAMPRTGGETDAGGFILGAQPEVYARLVAAGCVRVLLVGGEVFGFAVALPDPVLRASEVWRRRARIEWTGFDPAPLEREGVAIGYFDQLAVMPGIHVRAYGAALALATLAGLFAAGHSHVLTTTLREPVRNVAAHAYLRRIGARMVGVIDERYEGVGAVVSDIHHVDGATFEQHAAGFLRAGPRIRAMAQRALASVGYTLQPLGNIS